LLLAAIVATIALLLWRCEVEEQTIKLKPISFAEIEGWAGDNHAAAFATLLKSCRKRPASNSACKDALALGDNVDRDLARRFFETHYIPYRVDEEQPGLVTGYYEPELNGSRERSGNFQVPVYRRPDDLVQVKPDLLRAFYNDGLITRARKSSRVRFRAGGLSCFISTIPSSFFLCRSKARAVFG
jgi:membrane-bound lytic murein transglycosylase